MKQFAATVLDRPEEQFKQYSENQINLLLELGQHNTIVGKVVHDKGLDSLASTHLILSHQVCLDYFSESQADYDSTKETVECLVSIDFPLGHYQKPQALWDRLLNYRRFNRDTRIPSKRSREIRVPLERVVKSSRQYDTFIFGSVRYGDAKHNSDLNAYFFGNLPAERIKKMERDFKVKINPGTCLELWRIKEQLESIADLDFNPELYTHPWENYLEGVFLVGSNNWIDQQKTTDLQNKVLSTADKNPIFSHILAKKLSTSLGRRMARQ